MQQRKLEKDVKIHHRGIRILFYGVNHLRGYDDHVICFHKIGMGLYGDHALPA